MSFWKSPIQSTANAASSAWTWSKNAGVSLWQGGVAAKDVFIESPGRGLTLAWDGFQDGVAHGLGFVGGVVVGAGTGVAGAALDIGNLGVRAVSLNNWGRKDGSFTWDFAKAGYKGTHGAIHWLGKDILLDNVLDRTVNGALSLAGAPTIEREPVASAPGEGFIYGTGSFAGGIVGTAGGIKLVKWGGQALMLGFNSSSGATQAAAQGQKISKARAWSTFARDSSLHDKVGALIEGGRPDLAEKALRQAWVTDGVKIPLHNVAATLKTLPASQTAGLTNVMAELTTAQRAAVTGIRGLSDLSTSIAAKTSYLGHYPGSAALNVAGRGVAALGHVATNPYIAVPALATAAVTVPAVRNTVVGAVGGLAGEALEGLGVSNLFNQAVDKFAENPMVWGSIFGLGTFLATSLASGFIPQVSRFSELIGLAAAGLIVYSLYQSSKGRLSDAFGKEASGPLKVEEAEPKQTSSINQEALPPTALALAPA